MSEPNFSQLEIDLVRSYKYACEQLTLLRQYAESLEAAAAITPRELSNLRDDLRRAYALERQRAEAAEAQLAAVPVGAMRSIMMFCGAELADLSCRKDSRVIWSWLDAQTEVQP